MLRTNDYGIIDGPVTQQMLEGFEAVCAPISTDQKHRAEVLIVICYVLSPGRHPPAICDLGALGDLCAASSRTAPGRGP
jgi:hypothetical protein